jgi:putative thiamine transport system substrate-binding protein
MRRREFLIAAGASAAFPAFARTSWNETLAAAKGKPVFFNAWGGDERTNDFIAWTATRVRAEYGVDLRHVRLRDTAEAVQRVIAEKSAGRDAGGSVSSGSTGRISWR